MHVKSKCNQGKTTTTIFKEQEEETKWKYQQRVLDIDWNGIFHSPSFCNQQWDGSQLQLLSQTPSREALRKEWGTLLRADVSKYRPEVYKSEKSKILKKIHKVALGKLLT